MAAESTTPKRILVVDDDPAVRKILSKHLQRNGYEVITAEDGITALGMFEEQAVDLIILDVKMPGKDGFAVCQTIRQACNIPIIILTGDQRSMVKNYLPQMVEAAGASYYLRKPCDNKVLLKLVQDALADHASC